MGIELLNQIIRLADKHNQGRFRLEKDKEGKEKVGVYGNKGWFGKFRVALRNKNKMEAERVKLNTALGDSLVFDDRKNLVGNFLRDKNKFLDCKTIRQRNIKARVIEKKSPEEDMSHQDINVFSEKEREEKISTRDPEQNDSTMMESKKDISLYELIDLTKKELTAKSHCQWLCNEYLREEDLPLPGNQVKSGNGMLKKMTPEEIEKLERFPLGHLGYKFTKNYFRTNTILVAMTQEEIENYHQVKDRIGPLSEKEIKEREEIVKQFPYGDYGVKLVEKEEYQNQQKVICVDLVEMTGDEIKEYENPLGPCGYKFAEPDWDGKTDQEIENEYLEITEQYPNGSYGRKSDKDGWVVSMSQDEINEYNEKTQRRQKHQAWPEFKKRVLENTKTIEEYEQINKQFPSLQDGWAYIDIDEQKVKEYNEKETRFLNLCRFDRSDGIGGLNSPSTMDENEEKEYLERFPEFQKLILKGNIIQPDENVIEEYMTIKNQLVDGNVEFKLMPTENPNISEISPMSEAEIKDFKLKRERFLRYQAQMEVGVVPMSEAEIENYKNRKKRFPLGDSKIKSEIINYPDPTTKQLGLDELQKMQKAISNHGGMGHPYFGEGVPLSKKTLQERNLFDMRYQAITNCPAPYYHISPMNPGEKKEYQEAMIDPIIPCPAPKYRGYKIVYENTPKEAKDSKDDDQIYQITRIQSSWEEFQDFGNVNEINYKKRLQRVCRELDYTDIPKGLLNDQKKWKELGDQIARNIESEAKKVFHAAHTNFIEHNFVAPLNSLGREIIGDKGDEESFKIGSAYCLSFRRAKEVAEETIRNFLLESDPEKKKIIEAIKETLNNEFTLLDIYNGEEIRLTDENQSDELDIELDDIRVDFKFTPVDMNPSNPIPLNSLKEVANQSININEILNGAIEKYYINPDAETKEILREKLIRELSSDNEQGKNISNEIKAVTVIYWHYISIIENSYEGRFPTKPLNSAITKDVFSWESFLTVWNSSGNRTKGIDAAKKYKIFIKVCSRLEKERKNRKEITKDWADKVSKGLIEKYAQVYESIDNYMQNFDTLIKEPINKSIGEDATAINYFNRINGDALKKQFQKRFDSYLDDGDKLWAAKNLKEDIDKIVQQEIDRLTGLLRQREVKKFDILTQIKSNYPYYGNSFYSSNPKIKSTINTNLKTIDNVLSVGKQKGRFDSQLDILEESKPGIWNEVVWNIMAESSLDGETLDQLEISEELAWEIAYETIKRETKQK